MTREELKKLRIHYQVLKAQQRVLENPKLFIVEEVSAKIIHQAFQHVEADFPGLLPRFDIREAYAQDSCYELEPFRIYLATALGILEVQIEDEPSPVIEARTFSFVADPGFRRIVERDYVELLRAWVAQCWKSVIILAGGVIEAVLADLLLANQPAAISAAAAPKDSDILRWDLAKLIDVALELKLIGGGVSKLSHPVREFRNLVHPGVELRNKLVFGAEEARIAIEVINMLHRDLSP